MPLPDRRTRACARGDRGVAALITAMLMPVVLFMVMLVVQAGVYWNTQQRATAAAKRGAQAAALTTGTEASGLQAAETFLDGAAINDPEVDVQRGLDTVEVTVTGTAQQVVPGIVFTVTAVETAPVERFIPEDET